MNRHVWNAFVDELEKLGAPIPPAIQAYPPKGFTPLANMTNNMPVPHGQKLYIGSNDIPINKGRGISPYGPTSMV